jgi:hypothetical protein
MKLTDQQKQTLSQFMERTGLSEEEAQRYLEKAEWDLQSGLTILRNENNQAKDSGSDDSGELRGLINSINKKIEQLEGLGKKTEYIEKLKKIFSDEDGGLSQLERLEGLERKLSEMEKKSREMDEFFEKRLEEVTADLTDDEKALIPSGTPKQKLEWVEKFRKIHKKDEGAGDKKNLNFGNETPPERYKKLTYEDLLKDSKLMQEVMTKYPRLLDSLERKYFGQ